MFFCLLQKHSRPCNGFATLILNGINRQGFTVGVFMPNAVIEDWNKFAAFLSAQPLCQWSAQKQEEIAKGMHDVHAHPEIHAPGVKKKVDTELADALASMA